MEIAFPSAAREVTGSCHILRVDGKTVLLDCGIVQGHRRESRDKNLRLPCPVETVGAGRCTSAWYSCNDLSSHQRRGRTVFTPQTVLTHSVQGSVALLGIVCETLRRKE